MADWVDNYYDVADFLAEGVSMGCRVHVKPKVDKTASDQVNFGYACIVDNEGNLCITGLSMHFTGREDDG